MNSFDLNNTAYGDITDVVAQCSIPNNVIYNTGTSAKPFPIYSGVLNNQNATPTQTYTSNTTTQNILFEHYDIFSIAKNITPEILIEVLRANPTKEIAEAILRKPKVQDNEELIALCLSIVPEKYHLVRSENETILKLVKFAKLSNI